MADVTKPVTLSYLQRNGKLAWVYCNACVRERDLRPGDLGLALETLGPEAGKRLVCSDCRERKVTVQPELYPGASRPCAVSTEAPEHEQTLCKPGAAVQKTARTEPMCNVYSMTAYRRAIIDLFKVADNRATAIEPRDAIFPGNDAPIVRFAAAGERELVELSWGFVLNMQDRAPKRVTDVRDDNLQSCFWNASFRDRRRLVPATSFSEPKGKSPAIWHWFALGEEREPFGFGGIWRSYKGPIRKDGASVEVDVFAFLTIRPNDLVATVHPSRMPVMLVDEDAQATWLECGEDDAHKLIAPYPADQMALVPRGSDRADPVASSIVS